MSWPSSDSSSDSFVSLPADLFDFPLFPVEPSSAGVNTTDSLLPTHEQDDYSALFDLLSADINPFAAQTSAAPAPPTTPVPPNQLSSLGNSGFTFGRAEGYDHWGGAVQQQEHGHPSGSYYEQAGMISNPGPSRYVAVRRNSLLAYTPPTTPPVWPIGHPTLSSLLTTTTTTGTHLQEGTPYGHFPPPPVTAAQTGYPHHLPQYVAGYPQQPAPAGPSYHPYQIQSSTRAHEYGFDGIATAYGNPFEQSYPTPQSLNDSPTPQDHASPSIPSSSTLRPVKRKAEHIEEPPAAVQYYLCRWDNCNSEIDGALPSVRGHLRDDHGICLAKRMHQEDTVCRWAGCGLTRRVGGLARHIASIHFQSLVVSCEHCKAQFSRQDCIARHTCRFGDKAESRQAEQPLKATRESKRGRKKARRDLGGGKK